jgi:hypothetical protein
MARTCMIRNEIRQGPRGGAAATAGGCGCGCGLTWNGVAAESNAQTPIIR